MDFSQARTAPESVVRGLEQLDPTACLVHLGRAHWVVGKIRPNALVRAQAEAMLDNWTTNVREGKRMSPNGMARVRSAQLALLGFRPVQLYRIAGSPDGRIVQDFARSRFLWLTTSDNALLQQIDDTATERREAAQAEVGSLDRAKDAWRYAFTRSCMPSAARGPFDRTPAGWVRHDMSKAS